MSTMYDKIVLKNMMREAFNFEELDEFTFEHYPEVKKNSFSPALSLTARIITLIEYCEREGLLPNLIHKMKEARPKLYKKYAELLFVSRSTALVEFVADARVKLDDLTDTQKEALALSFKIGLAAVLGVDPGDINITGMESGSIKLNAMIPEELIPILVERRKQISDETSFSLRTIRLMPTEVELWVQPAEGVVRGPLLLDSRMKEPQAEETSGFLGALKASAQAIQQAIEESEEEPDEVDEE